MGVARVALTRAARLRRRVDTGAAPSWRETVPYAETNGPAPAAISRSGGGRRPVRSGHGLRTARVRPGGDARRGHPGHHLARGLAVLLDHAEGRRGKGAAVP